MSLGPSFGTQHGWQPPDIKLLVRWGILGPDIQMPGKGFVLGALWWGGAYSLGVGREPVVPEAGVVHGVSIHLTLFACTWLSCFLKDLV